MIIRMIKGLTIPVLLFASVFSRYSSYELAVNLAVCLGATILVQRAVRLKKYYWAVGFVSIAIVFSPLLLVLKIFLLMGLTCIGLFLALVAAFRRQPLPAV